jgi:DNA-binding CsgD family transcriptional regulator
MGDLQLELPSTAGRLQATGDRRRERLTLIGRAAELAAIDGTLDQARSGTSSILILKGEAGIGKSSLLAAAADRAQGMQVLRATGVESEIAIPFAGLHQLLRPAVSSIDKLVRPQALALRGALGLGDEPGSLFMVGAALLSLLAEVAEQQPLLFLIDDIHWLDEPSIAALTFAMRRLESEPVAGLVTIRQEASHRVTIPEIPVLEVKGLEVEAANQLLESLEIAVPVEVRRRLVRETQGNPLALKELSSALSTDQMAGKSALPTWLPVPDRLAHAYLERVRSLPGPTQDLLLLAATENEADLNTLEEAAAYLRSPEGQPLRPVEGGDLEQAERSRLVKVTGNRIAFCHPLVRSAIYQGASTAARLAAHRALATAPGGGNRDRKIWHLAMATSGKDEQIAAALEATADRAHRHQGSAAAAAALERAAALSEDEQLRARRLAKAAMSNLEGGWPDRAQILLNDAEGGAADPRVQAEIILCRARLIMHTTNSTNTDMEALLDGARLVESSDPYLAANMLSLGCFVGGFYEDWSIIVEAARRLLSLDIPDDSLYKRRGRDILSVFVSGGSLQGHYLRLPYQTLARQLAPEGLWPPTVTELGGAEDKASKLLQREARDLRRRGALWGLVPIVLSLAHSEYLLGHWGISESHLGEALSLAHQIGNEFMAAICLGLLARYAAVRGDASECERLAEQMCVSGSTSSLVDGYHRWSLALLDLSSGRARQARDRLATLAPLETWPARNHIALRASGDLAEAAIRCGRPDEAALVLNGLEGWSGPAPPAWAQVVLGRYRGVLAATPEAAEAHFQAAVSVKGAGQRPWELARAQLLYGSWLRRQKRKSEARFHLARALDTFDRLRASSWSRQTRSELQAAGETVPQPKVSTLERLTPQEVQIARLAALGLTNRQIGAELFLSPRTVGTHLYRLFPKLGIASRADLKSVDFEGLKSLISPG